MEIWKGALNHYVILMITQAGGGAAQAMNNTASAQGHNYSQESKSQLSYKIKVV